MGHAAALSKKENTYLCPRLIELCSNVCLVENEGDIEDSAVGGTASGGAPVGALPVEPAIGRGDQAEDWDQIFQHSFPASDDMQQSVLTQQTKTPTFPPAGTCDSDVEVVGCVCICKQCKRAAAVSKEGNDGPSGGSVCTTDEMPAKQLAADAVVDLSAGDESDNSSSFSKPQTANPIKGAQRFKPKVSLPAEAEANDSATARSSRDAMPAAKAKAKPDALPRLKRKGVKLDLSSVALGGPSSHPDATPRGEHPTDGKRLSKKSKKGAAPSGDGDEPPPPTTTAALESLRPPFSLSFRRPNPSAKNKYGEGYVLQAPGAPRRYSRMTKEDYLRLASPSDALVCFDFYVSGRATPWSAFSRPLPPRPHQACLASLQSVSYSPGGRVFSGVTIENVSC